MQLHRASFLFSAFIATAMWAAPTGAATITPFATGLYQSLYGITNDGTALYFTGSEGLFRDYESHPANGVVASIPLTGGTVTKLYSSAKYASSSGHVAPFQITTDRLGNLYWADPDAGPGTGASFLKGAVDGSTVSQIFGICCGSGVLPGDGVALTRSTAGHLYFGDATGGRIGADPTGSSAFQIGPTRYTPAFNSAAFLQIAVANGKIFIADSAEIRGASSNQKAAKVDQSGYITPGVRWISVDGSSGFIDLSVGKIAHPRGIVAVGKYVYVTSPKKVWRVNQTTGFAKVFAQDTRFQDLQGITYTNGSFYVLDSRTVFGTPVNGVAEAVKDGPGVIWKIVP